MFLHLMVGLVLGGYGLGSIFYGVFLLVGKTPFLWGARLALGVGFWAHVMHIGYGCFTRSPFWAIGPNESFSLFAALLVLGFFVLGVRLRIQMLGVVVPLASFFLFLASVALPEPVLNPAPTAALGGLASYWLPVHILGALAGEVLFALTAFLGMLYLLQERQLKSRRPGSMSRLIPSLEILDRFIEQNLKLGFLLLSLGMLAGALWAHMVMQKHWTIDPKQFWSIVTWCLYAVMLHARLHYQMKGRRGAIFSIIGFALVFFTFLGTNVFYTQGHGFWESRG